MHPDCIDFSAETAAFYSAMEQGLLKDNGSSIPMLPTYLTGVSKPPRNSTALAIDLGGTNIRVALMHFDDGGRASYEYYQTFLMPTRAMDKDEFFDEIAGYILPCVDKCDKIGFCFSYPIDMLPEKDARLICFGKKIKVKGSEGVLVGRELKNALSRRGVSADKHIVMLNDSPALLLGGIAASGYGEGGFAGFILGTGVNSCYIEKTANIKKLSGEYTEAEMIINLESGMYSGIKQSRADMAVDLKSGTPGEKRFEKMMSGAYLLDVFKETLRIAHSSRLISNELMTKADVEGLSFNEINGFCENPKESGLYSLTSSPEELRELFTLIYDRTAKLCSINIAALASKAARNGAVSIVVDGSTYHKNEILKNRVNYYINEYIIRKMGIDVKLSGFDNAVLTGTAIAALTN